MHPQLSDKKALVCKDFLEALEQCHSNNWARLLGRCNKQKEELNVCLRNERIERATENREMAKERKLKTEQARKNFYADE
ncbi:COX assembly mitochondrial protein [Mycena sanguinolenta]|uniref:COX assembly mitochondrial protein n=1 Tax=Mycena sanguinolenta TaxID=230812 RepID=A0A8H6YJ61_9AGAR|nr:COX assembly mitochondrial protein [Mycena sanguinolenta]